MEASIFRALFTLLFATAEGCIVVPFPNTSVDAYGVQSQVIDARTHSPIPHAQIYPDDAESRVEADDWGRFRIKSVTQWHAGYLIGPISYPIWPFTTDVTLPERSFRIVAAGYDEQLFTAGPEWLNQRATFPATCLRATIQYGTLYVSNVPMMKTQERTIETKPR